MAPTIFISYRRDDSAGFARALYDYLRQHVPADRLFLDVDAVAPGAAFARLATDRIARADVFLLLIGKAWLTIANERGRRLDQPDDLVRVEIETALHANVRIVPVLIDGATMPPPEALPPSLRPVTQFNAVALTHAHFHEQAARLRPLLVPPPTPRRAAALGVLALVCTGAALGLAWRPAGSGLAVVPGLIAALGAGVALVAALRAWRPALRLAAWPPLAGAGLALGLLGIVGVRALGYATAPFDLAVRLEAPDAGAPLQGEVELRYGQTTRRAPVQDARVVFADVPGRYRDALVVTPRVDGFRATPDSFGGAVHTLRLERAVFSTLVRGTVVDAAGTPLPGVVVDFDSGLATASTDSLGRFAVTVPRQAGTPLMLHATRAGHAGYHDLVTVSAAVPLRILFERP